MPRKSGESVWDGKRAEVAKKRELFSSCFGRGGWCCVTDGKVEIAPRYIEHIDRCATYAGK